MMNLETIERALSGWPRPRQVGSEIAVPTHCLYPSNGVVRVYVSGGQPVFMSDGKAELKVHDGGGAIDELPAVTNDMNETIRIIRGVARAQGLDVTDNGFIVSPSVSIMQLPGTIALVANASKESAHLLVEKHRPVSKRDFRESLARVIDVERAKGRFLDVAQEKRVGGASTKQHKFDYELLLNGKRRILLDAVMRDPNSINSVLASNIDVKAAELSDTIQRIVYDDEDDLKASDLGLLGLGAIVVPFSKLSLVLNRISA